MVLIPIGPLFPRRGHRKNSLFRFLTTPRARKCSIDSATDANNNTVSDPGLPEIMTQYPSLSAQPAASVAAPASAAAAAAAAVAIEAVAAVALASICTNNTTAMPFQAAPPPPTSLPDIAENVAVAELPRPTMRLPSIEDIIGTANTAPQIIPPTPAPLSSIIQGAPLQTSSAAASAPPQIAMPGLAADGQRLVFAPIHPGTVGRVQSACTYHRQIKKRCPDDCAHKQRELAQSEHERVMSGETRPVAVVVPLEKLRAESARKRELTLHKRRLKKVAKVAALNHHATPMVNGAAHMSSVPHPHALAHAPFDPRLVQSTPSQPNPFLMPQHNVAALGVGLPGVTPHHAFATSATGSFPELFRAVALASDAANVSTADAQRGPKRRRRRITVDLGDVSSNDEIDLDQASDEEYKA
jgi:hypothetical protein